MHAVSRVRKGAMCVGVLATLSAPVALTVSTAPVAHAQEAQNCQQALYPMVKDDRSSPAVWTDPAALVFGLGDAARSTAPVDLGGIASGTDVWMIGAVQKPGVPWLGANTMHESVVANTTGDVTWELSSFDGPGAMAVFASGNLGTAVGEMWFTADTSGVSGSTVIGANTHVHPNWVFDQPGTYHVGITQTAHLNDGTAVSGTATLTFNVGGEGNADSGHFDFGTQIDCDGAAPGGAEQASAGGGTAQQGGAAAGTSGGKDGNDDKKSAGAAAKSGGSGGTGGSANAGGKAPSNLAVTGAEPLILPIAVFAMGLVALGAGVTYRRARRG